MNINEFCDCTCEKLRQYMSERYGAVEVKLEEKVVLNGNRRKGIKISEENAMASPFYSVDSLYEAYLDGDSVEEVCKNLMERYELDMNGLQYVEATDLLDFDKMKDKIAIQVVNAKKNRSLLRLRPHFFVADLAAIYRVVLANNAGRELSISVDNQLMSAWKIETEELHKVAVKMTERRYPSVLAEMNTVLSQRGGEHGVFGENLLSGDAYQGDFMLVLSNEEHRDGAAVLANPIVMKRVLEAVQDDIYIIPSSVNEVLVLPKSKMKEMGTTGKEWGENVRKANEIMLDAKEWLSDRVYEMSRDDGKLKIVKESMEKTKEQER